MGCRQCSAEADSHHEVVLEGAKNGQLALLRRAEQEEQQNIPPFDKQKQQAHKSDVVTGSGMRLPRNDASATNPETTGAENGKFKESDHEGFRPRRSALQQQEVISITSSQRNQQPLKVEDARRLNERPTIIHYTAEEFHQAQMKHIEEMLNKKIRTVKEPVLLPSYIKRQPFGDRAGKFYIVELEKLPVECKSMPNWWVYSGQWDVGHPHGIGKIYHKDFTYEGYLDKGIPHLYGRFVTLDDVYEGEINMNVREGFGTLVTRSHYFFQGQWRNGQRNGHGFEIHKSGLVFEGLYKDNQVKKGQLYLPKGDVKKQVEILESKEYLKRVKVRWKEKYSGEFYNHKFQGEGIYVWSDHRNYAGHWKEGKMHGQGRFSWPNGKYYEGEYHKNKKQGYGIFVGGHKEYHGQWSQGLPHGRGKLVKGNLTEQHLWRHGKIINRNPNSDAVSMLSSYDQQKFQEEDRTMEIPRC